MSAATSRKVSSRKRTPLAKRTYSSHMDRCACEHCSANLAFALPDRLVDDVFADRVVLFAGAAVSTENPAVFPYTFYEGIRHELNLSPEDRPVFPDLMKRFCEE